MLRLVGSLGYFGVALLMVAENIIVPLPSELIMPLAGYEAQTGRLSLVGVIVFGTLGSVVGSLLVYTLARSMGRERVTGWVDRHGRWLLLRGRDLQKASHRFERHGVWAVMIGRLLPGIRGLIALPAGFAPMHAFLFTGATIASTLVWCAVLAIAGDLLGTQFREIHSIIGPISWVMLGILLIGVIVWIVRRRRR